MAERLPTPGASELERLLRELGPSIAFPPTPDLAPAVRRRLAAAPATRRRRLPPLRRAALALAAVLLLCALVVAASPAARSALAGRLGVRGVVIHQATAVPVAHPTATPGLTSEPTATPAPPGGNLHLGELAALADAGRRVAFPVPLPADLGPPDAVYVGTTAQDPPGGEVTLVYRPRGDLPESAQTGVGLLITEFQGTPNVDFFAKMVGPDTTIQRLSVDGGPGFWLAGQPHAFLYKDRSGTVRDETLRLAGNTLVWEHGALTLRVEGAITRERALQIAGSLDRGASGGTPTAGQ